MRKSYALNGKWQLSGGHVDNITAPVPGCVHTALLNQAQIADPYYRTQEKDALWVGETDWSYSRPFTITAVQLQHEKLLLRCYGLDTLATILINDNFVAKTDNMFRTYEFDIKPFVQAGENQIEIQFQAPVPYAKARLKEKYLHNWGVERGSMDDGAQVGIHKLPGGNYLRKAQCNFGWDWGPMVPTCGILRDIELIGYDSGRIRDVAIQQAHHDGTVDLAIQLKIERLVLGENEEIGDSPFFANVEVLFEGKRQMTERVAFEGDTAVLTLTLTEPELWWPNGLGEQPLYDVRVTLETADNTPIDSIQKRIGLRTLKLIRQPDEWGESFHFEANGVPFFAKGANWIPADSFFDWVTAQDYERLVRDSALANMNMLRVWGGGLYEPDVFYDLCDQYGICVWQDFMFACATYPVFDDEWLASVEQEARNNIRRLRHHASLALWCGNNEMEQGLVGPEETETTMSWAEYGRLFDQLLPALVQELDPQTDYWPCSPHTPIGDRHNFNDPTSGDAHIWNVWHGLEPFEFYRTCLHRFNSEFGFQSFPEPRTIASFTEAKDRNITTYVMEHHQRSLDGNQRIMHYMLDWFRLPTSFESSVWLSQIQQGMAIKYAVEHWRRTMPRGMGTLYWQLNDCWPVASWSSIDYYGRWKALHYMARHFFAPLLISGLEDVMVGTVEIHLTNDRVTPQTGEVIWQLLTADGQVVENGRLAANIPPLANYHLTTLDLKDSLATHTPRNLLLHLQLAVDGTAVSENVILFCRPKHLDLRTPNIQLEVLENELGQFEATVRSDQVALWAWLESGDVECRFSDNFFHLLPSQSKTITIEGDERVALEALKTAVHTQSLTDTYAES